MEEMSLITILEIVKYVCFGLAAVFLIVAVILFVALDIKRVFGDLSGRTAKREIENIRSKNVQSGEKAYKPSHVNQSRGKLTAKISESGRVAPDTPDPVGTMFETEKIDQPYVEQTTLLNNGMQADDQTTLLDSYQSEGTTVLSAQLDNGTTVLSNQQDNGTTVLGASIGNVTLLDEITYVFADEVIS